MHGFDYPWVVAVYLLAFLISLWRRQAAWSLAHGAAQLALLLSLLVPVAGWLELLPRVSPLAALMTLLVSLLAWVITTYSQTYLTGEPRQAVFVRALLGTLTAVLLLLASDHLLVIFGAWAATSIGLHYLLLFYPQRKAAQLVAHKKFIVSRLAEVLLLIAAIFLYLSIESWWLADVHSAVATAEVLDSKLSAAMLLITIAVILKTAQLPLHGWLIQVMEAPTPVSALLHAGVINMGGIILLLLAPWLDRVPAAQWLLLIVGGITAVVAGWVMMTRISIKVRLAWSTCAQMGFMLMEIGLGLYELALLHIVAHSLYKAYAFLAAGDTVQHATARDFWQPYVPHQGVWLALLLSVLAVGLLGLAWQLSPLAWQLPLASLLLVSFGLAPLLWRTGEHTLRHWLQAAGRWFALFHLYLLWHALFAQWLSASPRDSISMLVLTTLLLSLLYVAQWAVYRYRQHDGMRRLYPWVYNGFYLDETFTRLTFKLWPIRLTEEQAQTQVNRVTTGVPRG